MPYVMRLVGFAFVVAFAVQLFSTAQETRPALVVPKSPLSPEDEKAILKLAPGLRIDLVAAEPLVESPVFCVFDEKARLWVVEMRDYPNGPGPGKPGEGRIKILEDKDGDGVFDSATIFAENLLFANGVLPWKNGAIVTMAPNIVYLKDTNGDGKADETEVLYEGFVAGNPQLRVSHPMLGPDGWISVANGLRSNGEIRRAGKPDRPAIPLSGKDFRFDMVHDRAEAIPGMGQFGNTFDHLGNRFVCDNRHHIRHVVFPTDPSLGNPLLAVPSLLQDTDSDAKGGSRVFPLSRNWTTSNLHAGQFTAACGVYVDKGGLLPAPYAGAAYTCDPTGNLVHCEVLTPSGATFTSKPWKDGVEFLASPDEWFRPVSLTNAPDGSLFVVDMYRAVIEHPDFMPTELKNRPDLILGKDRGRIWRIAPEGNAPKKYSPIASNPATLVKTLGDPNGWARTTAQRLLLTSEDMSVAPALKAVAASESSPAASIFAAWLLAGRGELPDELLHRLAASTASGSAEQAIRLMEATRKPGSPVPPDLLRLAESDQPRVRFEVAVALGAWDDDAIVEPLLAIARQPSSDSWTRLAIAASAGKRTATLLTKMFEDPRFFKGDLSRTPIVKDLCELLGSGRDAGQVGAVLTAASKLESADLQTAVLVGLAEGVSRRGTSFPVFLASLPDPAIAKLAGAMLVKKSEAVLDPKTTEEARVAALKLLAHTPWSTSGPILSGIVLDAAAATPVRVAAIRAMSAHSDPSIAATLLKGWRGYTPSIRTDVLDGMLRRPDRVKALLDEVEAGRVKPGDIDTPRAKRLMATKDPSVAAKALKLLRASLPADRKEVLAKYRPALELAADAHRGREAFKKICAACHVIGGIGTQVGPDISDTRTKTPEMLLTDILNPNAAIDGNFISYTIMTKDGKQLTGVIAAESTASITLKRENNQGETVLRADVEEIRSSGLSLMPDGVEKNLSVQEVADLIHFLKDWRYLDGMTPKGP